MATDFGVPFLGRIPLDPQLARACDEGQSYVDRCPDSAGAKAFHAVFNRTLVLSHVSFLARWLCIATTGVGDRRLSSSKTGITEIVKANKTAA
jgi:hypothetical protein